MLLPQSSLQTSTVQRTSDMLVLSQLELVDSPAEIGQLQILLQARW